MRRDIEKLIKNVVQDDLSTSIKETIGYFIIDYLKENKVNIHELSPYTEVKINDYNGNKEVWFMINKGNGISYKTIPKRFALFDDKSYYIEGLLINDIAE